MDERPHQALAIRCRAKHYSPSPRPHAGLPELGYPFHDKAITVTTFGRICSTARRSISVKSSPARPSRSTTISASFMH
jgi:hypothetical protein